MQLIVAVDENWAIGREGDQLAYISQDLRRFQALTRGHTVILGRKTLATFPGGRPLKNRRNLILSRSTAAVEGAEVFPQVEALLAQAPQDAFVIGGESVYRQLLPYCDRAYVTKIARAFPADTFFPNLDLDPQWRVAQEEGPYEEDGLAFSYVTYLRQ